MSDDRDIRTRLDGMFDDLDARAQRMSAEDMAQRPIDQRSGAPARMSAQYESVSGGGGVRIENLRKLYDEGICESCLVPLGRRTRVPMRVFFDDGQSRWYDGLLAQLDERPRGPTYRLYTQRFLDWLLPDEQHCLKWREVIVVNATKITRRIFEPLPSRVHVAVATLRGGYIERAMCSACGRGREASYPLAGSLPNWLNPEGSTRHTGQPRQYLVRQSLPDPPPASFTMGNPHFGLGLVFTNPITASRRRKLRAITSSPVCVVDIGLTIQAADH